MTPDIEKYRKYVDKFDLPDNEKIELIHTVWHVMESFVDTAFGVNSTQTAMSARNAKDAIDQSPVLELKAHDVSYGSIAMKFNDKTKIR